MAEPRMRIGELAEATGTTPRALRHYEQAGLITSERAANGYRLYDAAAAVRVRNIRHLLDVGLTLDDVRVFLPCLDGDVMAGPASDRAVRTAAERLAVLDARIAAQVAVRDRLAAVLHARGVRTPAPTSGTPRPTPATPARPAAFRRPSRSSGAAPAPGAPPA
ncbi:DNA-binding transcriptional MerR regulator [Streptomyces violarus]|uniref:DNA-binding transcriptional MerR regulator n=1 Tax=Streptomyces violarus TaxID=67380 RepID=A0A7W5F577_9ACTN|nr:DNA-binding transcriptional MerR regulator [Streptomyces violarus]